MGSTISPTMVRVKVCGITTPEDARLAASAGADAIGLIFAESPRRIGVKQARRIADVLPEGVSKVGVFVNSEPQEILEVAEAVGLDYAQLHGDEAPDVVEALQSCGLGVIKALRVRDADSLAAMDGYGADFFLLDSYSERVRGGSGERFDWALAKAMKGCVNIFVSGGLTPENVREAVEFLRPYGVDASSSLEDAPGKKNGERVRRFVSAAKGY